MVGRTPKSPPTAFKATVSPFAIREIWSIAYRLKEAIPAEVANRLLEQNGQVTLGAWHIRKMGTDHGASFSAQIAADTDQTTLRWALYGLPPRAHQMQKELTQKDEL